MIEPDNEVEKVMSTKLKLNLMGLVVGLSAFAWFWYLTDWKVATALLLVLFGNNMSQTKSTS